MELLVSLFLIGCLLCIILILFLATSNRKLRKQVLLQKQENKMLQEGQQKLDELLINLRSQRHDMMKHVTALQYLIDQNDIAEASSYMKQWIVSYDSVNSSLKGEQGHLAAFLNYTRRAANAHNIEILYDLEEPLTRLPIPMIEQSTLVGNLLFNSLDAAVDYSLAFNTGAIKVSSAINSGLYVLKIANSSLPIEQHILDHLFVKQGLSSKDGNHEGLGTWIIAKVVKQNHGTIDYRYWDNQFTVKVKLPILSSATK